MISRYHWPNSSLSIKYFYTEKKLQELAKETYPLFQSRLLFGTYSMHKQSELCSKEGSTSNNWRLNSLKDQIIPCGPNCPINQNNETHKNWSVELWLKAIHDVKKLNLRVSVGLAGGSNNWVLMDIGKKRCSIVSSVLLLLTSQL